MGINIDLSKAFHPRLIDVLTAFIPGLFFEISVLVANPALVVSLTKPPLDRPMTIVIALVMAFIIGNFFMVWVNFIQMTMIPLVGLGCRLFGPLKMKLFQYLLHARGDPPRASWLGQFRFVQDAYRNALESETHFQDVARAWVRVATRILAFYDIEPPDRGRDSDGWMPWTFALGRYKSEDFRGHVLAPPSQATGWSGLIAMHFAPQLHTSYFIAFCLLSVGFGLISAFLVGLNLGLRERSWQLGLLRAYEELKWAVGNECEEKEVS